MNKYILITHDDLDGAGCAIVFNEFIKEMKAEGKTYHCDVVKCGEAIEDVCNNHKDVHTLYIADITPKEQKYLDMLQAANIHTVILDHHETAEERFKSFIIPPNVSATFDCFNKCGTKLLYEHLDLDFEDSAFVDIIDDYDRFVLKYPQSIRFNQLFRLMGIEDFIERGILDSLTLEEAEMLRAVDMQERNYIAEAMSNMLITYFDGIKFGIVYSDTKSTSMLAKAMREDKFDVDALAVVNLNTMSVSLRKISDDFHCGNFARYMDTRGGGHAEAGGFNLNEDNFDIFTELAKKRI